MNTGCYTPGGSSGLYARTIHLADDAPVLCLTWQGGLPQARLGFYAVRPYAQPSGRHTSVTSWSAGTSSGVVR